jgi:hypothetical protein
MAVHVQDSTKKFILDFQDPTKKIIFTYSYVHHPFYSSCPIMDKAIFRHFETCFSVIGASTPISQNEFPSYHAPTLTAPGSMELV